MITSGSCEESKQKNTVSKEYAFMTSHFLKPRFLRRTPAVSPTGALQRCSSSRVACIRWIRLRKSSSGTVGARFRSADPHVPSGNDVRWSSIRVDCEQKDKTLSRSWAVCMTSRSLFACRSRSRRKEHRHYIWHVNEPLQTESYLWKLLQRNYKLNEK